jgi:hypothetical protein
MAMQHLLELALTWGLQRATHPPKEARQHGLVCMADSSAISFPDPSRGGVSVAVVVRAKPPAPVDSPLVVSMTRKSTTISMPNRKTKQADKTFNFDRCYWSVAKSDPDFASQEDVFSEVRHSETFASCVLLFWRRCCAAGDGCCGFRVVFGGCVPIGWVCFRNYRV